MRRVVTIAALGWSLGTGCVLGPRASYEANSTVLQLPPVVVYQGSTGSLSYHSPVGRDARRLVPRQRAEGRACQRGVQIPIFGALYAIGTRASRQGVWLSSGWGDGAYGSALEDLRRQVPPDALLYDVRADLDVRMILSVYREQCLVLDAGVLVPEAPPSGEQQPAPPPAPAPN